MYTKWMAGLMGLAAAVAVMLPWAQGQGIAGTELEDDADVTIITSERLTFDYSKNYAVFEENVVVTDPGMKLTTDKLAVWFDEEGEISLIKAEGAVHIYQEDKTATAGEATYDVPSGKIVLIKNPRLKRGRHYLEGTTITYWRNDELLVVEPQSRLVIYPEDRDSNSLNLLGP